MVLYINACARKDSRTKRLADSFVSTLENVRQLDLYQENIPLLDENAIIEREDAARKGNVGNRFVALAKEFSQAYRIIIAAPYWDLSYPAILRSYIEAIMVNGITFRYDAEGNPSGMCLAREIVFISTSGGMVVKPNTGFEHIKALATTMLGIPKVFYFCAEGLDIVGANPEQIIEDKKAELSGFRDTYVSTSYGNHTIMVVDDSKVNILKAEHILKENGYDTVAALSGEDCLKKLKVNQVDLILLDIEMPGMDGFQTLEALRANPHTKDIPVIFVTGDKTMDVVIKASSSGVAGYVTKPFSEEELMVHIKKGTSFKA